MGTSEAAIKRWQSPEFRAAMSKKMSAGAKARWADPIKRAAVLASKTPESIRLTSQHSAATRKRRMAERYNITFKRYESLSNHEKWLLGNAYRNAKKPWIPPPTVIRMAKLVGVTPEEYKSMNKEDRRRAKHRAMYGYKRGPHKEKKK